MSKTSSLDQWMPFIIIIGGVLVFSAIYLWALRHPSSKTVQIEKGPIKERIGETVYFHQIKARYPTGRFGRPYLEIWIKTSFQMNFKVTNRNPNFSEHEKIQKPLHSLFQQGACEIKLSEGVLSAEFNPELVDKRMVPEFDLRTVDTAEVATLLTIIATSLHAQ